MRNKVLQLYR